MKGLSNRFKKDNPVARTAAWQNKSEGVEACLLLALFLRVPQTCEAFIRQFSSPSGIFKIQFKTAVSGVREETVHCYIPFSVLWHVLIFTESHLPIIL